MTDIIENEEIESSKDAIKNDLDRLQNELNDIKDTESRIGNNAKKEKLDKIWTEILSINDKLWNLEASLDGSENPYSDELSELRSQVDTLKSDVESMSSSIDVALTKTWIEVVTWSTPEAKQFIKDLPSNVKEVKYKVDPDFSTIGTHELILLITYNDGSTDEMTVQYNVVEKKWFFNRLWRQWRKLRSKQEWKDNKWENILRTVSAAWVVAWAIWTWAYIKKTAEERRAERQAKREARKAEREAKREERRKKWKKGLAWVGWLFGWYYVAHWATTRRWHPRDLFNWTKKEKEPKAK